MYKGFFEQRVKLISEITDADSRGTSGTMFGNQAVVHTGEISEASTKNLVFLSAVHEVKVPQGFGQYLSRYISLMDSADTITVTQNEGIATDLVNTEYNEPTANYITPLPYYVKSIIGRVAQYKNVDQIDERQTRSLSDAFADKVDIHIATALAGATEMTNSVRGAALIYAGGKLADDQITSGDIMSVSLVNEAKTRLRKKEAFYWNAEVLTKSALTKNTWKSQADDPFVLVIGEDQEKAFLESSQFLGANQYGNNTPLLNGEIGALGSGPILGVRIVISSNIPTTDKDSAAWDTTTNTTVDLARCFLMKGMAAYDFAWGQEPVFERLPSPDRLGDILRLWGMYEGAVLHGDAIVKIDVATNIPVF